MIRVEVHPDRQVFTLHVDADGIENLALALDDARRGCKVFLGNRPLLIIRPDGYRGGEDYEGATEVADLERPEASE